MKLSEYDNRPVRVTDRQGRTFEGIAKAFPSGYGPRTSGREAECLRLGDVCLFEGDVEAVEALMTFDEAVAAIPPGRYRHFKGNEYEVLAIARHSETELPLVVYRMLYGDHGVWVRPADMWCETVTRDGHTFRRFERVE